MRSLNTTNSEKSQNLVPETVWEKINEARNKYPELSWLPMGGAHPNRIRRLVTQHLLTIKDSSAKKTLLEISEFLKWERSWFDELIDNEQQELWTALTNPEAIKNPYASMDRGDIARAINNQQMKLAPEQMDMAVDALVWQAQDPEMPLTAYYLVLDQEEKWYAFSKEQVDKLITIFEINETDPKNYISIGYLVEDCHQNLSKEQIDSLLKRLKALETPENLQQIGRIWDSIAKKGI